MAVTRIHGHNAGLSLGGVATPLIDVSGDANDIAVDITVETYEDQGYGANWFDYDQGHFGWKIVGKLYYGTGVSQVTQITVGNPTVNSGYANVPTVTITAPTGPGGVQATATAIVVAGRVTQVVVTNPGSGYLTAPTIGFTPTGGDTPSPAATATATIGAYNGQWIWPILSVSPVYMQFRPAGGVAASGKEQWTGTFLMDTYKISTPQKGATMIEFSGKGKGTLTPGVL